MRTSSLASLAPLLAASLLALAFAAPSAALAQPVVVVGPPDTGSGPPSQLAPAVPPGYEVEGQIGGMYFRGRVYTPTAPTQTVPAPAAPPVVSAPPAVAPAPAPAPIFVAPPPTTQPTYVVVPPVDDERPPIAGAQAWSARHTAQDRLADDGMGFGGRLAFDVLGAGVGVGLGVALGYAFFGESHEDGAMLAMAYMTTAGIAPTTITLFGGAIAGGRGRFGAAMLGELVGGGLAATLVYGLDADLDPWQNFGVIVGSAMVGAILGIEIQHALRTARLEREAEREGGLELSSVAVTPTSQGNGVVLSVGGTF